MRSVFELFPPGWRSEPTTRRTISIALVIVVHLLAVLLAWLMSPPIGLRKAEPEVQSFPLLNVFDKLIAPKPTPRSEDKRQRKTEAVTPRAPEAPVDPPASPLKMMIVSSDVFAASDIGRITAQSATAAPGGPNGDDSEGAGEGPGGAPLYNAQWYREPTDAEMAYYLPKGMPRAGWGMIICKTIPDYRVEDCRELGEAPLGSGFARSIRQAAWQFRVRPPRMGGKPLIGAWVRIRYEMTVGFTK